MGVCGSGMSVCEWCEWVALPAQHVSLGGTSRGRRSLCMVALWPLVSMHGEDCRERGS